MNEKLFSLAKDLAVFNESGVHIVVDEYKDLPRLPKMEFRKALRKQRRTLRRVGLEMKMEAFFFRKDKRPVKFGLYGWSRFKFEMWLIRKRLLAKLRERISAILMPCGAKKDGDHE